MAIAGGIRGAAVELAMCETIEMPSIADAEIVLEAEILPTGWTHPEGRFGEFTSCSGYPECKYIKQNFIGMKCPQCKEGELVEKKARRGNFFYGCSEYPKCDFTSNWKPIDEKCPECGHPYLVEKILKSGPVIACPNKECDYERPAPAPEAAASASASSPSD